MNTKIATEENLDVTKLRQTQTKPLSTIGKYQLIYDGCNVTDIQILQL